MKKRKIVALIKQTVEHSIPEEVSQWIQREVPIVVDDLSNWELTPSRRNIKGVDLLGVFGLENGKPIIGMNYKTLKTIQEVVKTTCHEIGHAWRWHLGLPYGERPTNKLVKCWATSETLL